MGQILDYNNLIPSNLKNVTGVAGGAILGDGRVGLILDLDRISRVKDQ